MAQAFARLTESENPFVISTKQPIREKQLLYLLKESFDSRFVPSPNAEIELVKLRKCSREQVAKSFVHQLDCLLRKEVGVQMQNISENVNRKNVAQKFNQIRQDVLEETRKTISNQHSAGFDQADIESSREGEETYSEAQFQQLLDIFRQRTTQILDQQSEYQQIFSLYKQQ